MKKIRTGQVEQPEILKGMCACVKARAYRYVYVYCLSAYVYRRGRARTCVYVCV